MDADALILRLQAVLGVHMPTGKLTLHLKDGRLESFEVAIHGRPKGRSATIGLDERHGVTHTAGH